LPVAPKPVIPAAGDAAGELPPNILRGFKSAAAAAPTLPKNHRRFHLSLNTMAYEAFFAARTTAAVQFTSTKDSPGSMETATQVRAGPPFGKYVLKTLLNPSY
jgi:hypothetical protein